MTFHVGQKVVCVDDDLWGGISEGVDNAGQFIQRGSVYVIRGIGAHPDPLFADITSLYLEGIERIAWNTDWPFAARRFRPAVEKKTDISVFTAMLTPKKRELVLTSIERNGA